MTEDKIFDSELDEEETEISDDDSDDLDQVMEPFNPSEIDVGVETRSLDSLIERIKNGEIDMNTDFQRHAELWNNGKMSKLIESILIRFPLPAFYFDASDENKWLIVDGLQRLSSIKKYVIDNDLQLSGLEFFKDFSGLKFDKLPRQYQRRIRECQVIVYLIKPGSPDEVKYSVFRRINTGGLTLTNQEIRNALANPRDRKLLEKLASHEDSTRMIGNLSKRMKDQELVLRFWSFYRFDYFEKHNKKELAVFLDRAMEEIKQGDDQFQVEVENTYLLAINRCYALLGKYGFVKKPMSHSTKQKINSSLFEVWMVCLAKLEEGQFNKLLAKQQAFQARVSDLLNDTEFQNSITFSTQKVNHVVTRYNKVESLIKEVLHA